MPGPAIWRRWCVRDYDEEAELTHYVIRWAGSHMTELEHRVRRVLLFRAKGHGRLLEPRRAG